MVKILGAPAILYIAGIAAIFFADIQIAKSTETNQIVYWSQFRGLMTFIPAILLLGSNMAVIRYDEFQGITSIQSCLFLLFSWAFFLLSLVTTNQSLTVFSGLFSLASAIAMGSSLRAQKKFTFSITCLNLWKLSIVMVVILSQENMAIVFFAIMTSCTATFIFRLSTESEFRKSLYSTSATLKAIARPMYQNSLQLAVSAAISGISASFFIVNANLIFNKDQIVWIFQLILIFQAPAVIASGFVGFILTPYFRTNEIAATRYIAARKFVLLGVLLLAIAIFPALLEVHKYFFKSEMGATPLLIPILLSIEAGLRTFYTCESAYFGARFRTPSLKRFVARSAIAIVAFSLVVYVLAILEMITPQIVIIVSLIHWISRLLIMSREINSSPQKLEQ